MRKIISFILCAAMVLSFSSVTAFADEITYKDISILADELAGTADENVKTIQKALEIMQLMKKDTEFIFLKEGLILIQH